ncbi:DUF6452 family protein [Formosa sp. Hel1_31_208]|uniref:DUF6452 family protein n=1 Tax=Formosa sp. Hel1_31_208 TaxID=1798225 RepID=UPI000B86DA51|nr:DUF6452 family protein [Formosa sp. Hel1_31_208]
MKKVVPLLIIISSIAVILLACERDDICPEDTATTPSLIIRFYNINDQDELKSVRLLRVKGLNDNDEPLNEIPVNRASPDSIVLPLRFANEGTETITRFQLEKDSDLADNDNPDNDSNIDIIEVRYTPEFIYVSRACGLKSIFNFGTTGGVSRDNDDDNWIINTEIINETIDNENAAHVIIYH